MLKKNNETKNNLKEKMKEIKKIDDDLFSKEKNNAKNDDKNNEKENNTKNGKSDKKGNKSKKNKKKTEEKLELFSDDNVEVVELNEVRSASMVKSSNKATLTKEERLAKEKKVDEKIRADEQRKKGQKIIKEKDNNIDKNNENDNYNDKSNEKEDNLFENYNDNDEDEDDNDYEIIEVKEAKLGSEKFVTQRLETITDEILLEKQAQEQEKNKVQKNRIEKLSKKGIEAVSKRFKITENYMKDLKTSILKDAISIVATVLLFVGTYYLCRGTNTQGDMLKIIAVILQLVSIAILEISYRKEKIGYFIRGIELSAISYIYIYFLNMLGYVNAGKNTYITLIAIIAIYYVLKMFLTKNIIKGKNYNKYIDIKEITKDNKDNE